MSEELLKAEKDLADFLEKNPHLQEEQNKINEIMEKVPFEKRMEVIGMLMSKKLLQLSSELLNLTQLVSNQEDTK